MVWKPHVTVAALAQDDSGRFLLVEEHADGRTVLNQPAGHLEPGESLIEAVTRETLEETGCHFQPEALVGIYRWENAARGKTYLRATFAGTVSGAEPDRPLDEGILRALWLSRAEIDAARQRLRSPLVWRGIEDHDAGRRFPLDILQEL